MNKFFNVLRKTNHWTMFLMFLFLGMTGILGVTVFAIPELVEKLDFAFGLSELNIGMATKVIIAKVFRGQMWEWHYIIGLAFTALAFVSIVLSLPKYSFRKNPFPVIFLLVVIVLCITGVIRYYRGELSFTNEQDKFWRNLSRATHYYAAWALLVASILHVAHIIYLNCNVHKTLISDMFSSKNLYLKKIWLSLTLTFCFSVFGAMPAYANANENIENQPPYLIITKYSNKLLEEKNYQEAMEYYSGKKGAWTEKKTFPNCPYDACKKSTDVVQSFEENGTKYYNIQIHNFQKAKEFFDKSIAETKNPFAAEKNMIMIMERVNYKSKYYADFLLNHVKESLGIDGEEAIKKEVQKNIVHIDPNNSSMMLYKTAEVYENGFFGVEKNIEKAKFFYQTVVDRNESENLYFMLSKNKLNILSKKDV